MSNTTITELKWFSAIKNDEALISSSKVFNIDRPFSYDILNDLLAIFREKIKSCKTLREAFRQSFLSLADIHPQNQLRQEIRQSEGFSALINGYEETIIEELSKRSLKDTCYNLINSFDLISYKDAKTNIDNTLNDIEEFNYQENEEDKESAYQEWCKQMDKIKRGEVNTFFRTGFNELDKLLKIEKKKLIVPCARPSIGKTAFAISMMSNMTYNDIHCGFVSVETATKGIMERLASISTGIPSEMIMPNEHGMIESEQQFEQCFTLLNEEMIKIKNDDKSQIEVLTNRDIDNVLRSIMKMKRNNHRLDVVFVDYIQKITSSNGFSKTDQIGDVTGKLADLSKKLDIAIVALAQLNRDSENEKETIPSLKHLEGSANIEKDADAVVIIHRSRNAFLEASSKETTRISIFKDTQEEQDLTNLQSYLYVAKNRDGRTGFAKTVYNATCTRFENYCEMASWERQSHVN